MAAEFDDFHWVLGIVAQFKMWILIAGILLIGSTVVLKRNRLAFFLVLSISVAINLDTLVPYWNLNSKDLGIKSSNMDISLFYANVYSNNKSKHKLRNYLLEKRPDFVLLVETNASWVKALKGLEEIYPYIESIPREDNFGLTVLGRRELKVLNIFFGADRETPSLLFQSEAHGFHLNILLLHAFPPIGSYGTLLRDEYLQSLSSRIKKIQPPLIVCGDFNTVPWATVFKNFVVQAELSFADNHGVPATWPSIPYIGIPIDHCLVRQAEIVSYKTGPNIGSDHLPLELKVRL